jgi:CheY-like chemotaxis protein
MHVIYIDDDAASRLVVRAMLRASHIRIDEAADVQTGLQMVAEGDYQAVLIDLRMPGMNGLTGIRQLRARYDCKKQLPIIVVSGDLSPGVRHLCSEAGANDFLEKPVRMPVLLAKIGVAAGNGRSAPGLTAR